MMQTRCPACATIFRITSEQIKARHGQVRCGQCQRVFNALDTLLETALPPLAPAPAASPDVELPTTPPPNVSEVTEIAEIDGLAEETSNAAQRPDSPDTPDTPTASRIRETLDASPVFASHPDAANAAASASRWSFETVEDVPPPPSARKSALILAILLSLLALLALLLQLAVQFRGTLIEQAPQTRPILQHLCEVLGCEITLPHHAESLIIEDSALHPDPRHKDEMQLSVTLKNRARFAQQYPHLEVTLRDAYDQALLRKVISPREYLPSEKDPAKGIGPEEEIDLHLALKTDPSLRGTPVGYLLYLFYP